MRHTSMGARSPARVRVGRATRRSDKFHEVGRADHGNRGGDRDGHGGCWRIDRAGVVWGLWGGGGAPGSRPCEAGFATGRGGRA
jgi:hypothetical protein